MLTLRTHPDPCLREACAPIGAITPEILALAAGMISVMRNARGIGLAAPQVGALQRIFVMEIPSNTPAPDPETVSQDETEAEDDGGDGHSDGDDADADVGDDTGSDTGDDHVEIMINPEILEASTATNIHDETCLSLPGDRRRVERPATIRVGWTDLNGLRQDGFAEGLRATCIQHEMDHLDGVLILDHPEVPAQAQDLQSAASPVSGSDPE